MAGDKGQRDEKHAELNAEIDQIGRATGMMKPFMGQWKIVKCNVWRSSGLKSGIRAVMALTLAVCMMLTGLLSGMGDMSFARAVSVASINSGGSKIYSGYTFTLTVTTSEACDSVRMSSTTNFTPTTGVFTLTKSTPTSFNISLKYNGAGNAVVLTMDPGAAGGGDEVTETIIVSDAMETVKADPSESEKEDTTKKKPMIKVASESMATVYSGETATIRVPLENYTSYEAKNIIVSIDGAAQTPFLRQQSDFSAKVSSLTRSTTQYADFKVAISKTAESKIYEIPLIVKYENAYGDSFPELTLKYYVKVKNSQQNVEPTVGITDYYMKKEALAAGGTDTLTLRVENKGSSEATDIRVELSGFDKNGVRINKDVETKYFNSLVGKDFTNMTFGVAASTGAKTDTYELQAKISYLDETGKKYERTTKLFLYVEGKDSSAMDFTIANVKAPSNIVGGDSFSVAFDLKNSGVVNGDIIEVSVEYPAKMIPKSSPKKQIKNLAAGKSQHFQFDFKSLEDMETNNYDFYISVKYNAKGAKTEDAATIKEYVGVFVNGTSAAGRPKIIVQDYDIGMEAVPAGQEFPLKMTLRNTSGIEAIKNIKVKITSDEGVFTPVGSSSAFFIDRIDKNGTTQKELRFKVKADAQVKSYNMKIEMEYEDSKGNAYDAQKQAFKEEESIALPVEQPIRLEIGDVNVPQEVYMGMPVTVDTEFYNMGKSTLYNLFVKLEGGFDIQEGSVFIGNFDAGRSEFFSANVIPTQPGPAEGKITFSFEDSVGNKKTVEKLIKFNVMDGPPVDPNMPVEPEPGSEGGMAKIKMFFAGTMGKVVMAAIALAAIGGGSFFVMKKRKAKKLAAAKAILEDEDDDQ